MVELKYKKGFIVLTPSNSDENNALIARIASMAGVDYYEGSWMIGGEHLSALRQNLKGAPLEYTIFTSFKEFSAVANTPSDDLTIVVLAGVNYSKIRGSLVPDDLLKNACRYFFLPAKNDKRFIEKKWDGYINLYNKRSFPTGLLHIVEEILKKQKLKYRVEYLYNRTPAKEFDMTIDDGLIADDDQVKAVAAAKEGLRGIIKAPTGFGKTAILAKRIIAEFGVPTLFIANKKALLDDACFEFMNGTNLKQVQQIKDGVFGDTKILPGMTPDQIKALEGPVIVATIQSLSARLKDAKTGQHLRHWMQNECKLLMVDECQAVNDKTWKEVLDECHAPLRLMLSATPKRTDGGKLEIHAQSGPGLFHTTAEEQILKGRLCELEIVYEVFDHGLYNESDEGLVYSDVYTAWITENEERNKLVIKHTLEMLEEDRFVLILISHIEHGEKLKTMLLDCNLTEDDVRFIYGGTSDKARTSAIKDFRTGSFKVLIGSTIFDAGVNIPLISGIVMAGAGNSEITLVQRIGRGARNADYEKILGRTPLFLSNNNGIKKAKIVDFFDDNVRFFKSQSWNRYKTAKEEFGVSRVSIKGSITSYKKQSKVKIEDEVSDKAMEEALKAFENMPGMKEHFNNSFKSIIDDFK